MESFFGWLDYHLEQVPDWVYLLFVIGVVARLVANFLKKHWR